MAIYHLSAKPISRAQGRSATGAAAYRAGVEITDERTGLVHDYTRKGGVLHSNSSCRAVEPPTGPVLERHRSAPQARRCCPRQEVEISLPTELTAEQRQALAVGYARELADRYGVAADVALHAPRTVTDRELEKNPDQYHETDPETGRRHNGNWHAHIMLSACHVQPDGTLGKKAVELDPIHCQRAKIENMADRERARWGELANAALERHGHEARIDHRSHAERGIEAEPSQHLGPQAHGYERRTGQPSAKRIQQEQEAAERLARAKALGELERQGKALDRGIIDLSGDMREALRERDQLQAERDRKPAAPSQDELRAGMEAARAQFEAHKLAEAGKGAGPRSLRAIQGRAASRRAGTPAGRREGGAGAGAAARGSRAQAAGRTGAAAAQAQPRQRRAELVKIVFALHVQMIYYVVQEVTP